MKLLARISSIILLMLLPFIMMAHGYWIETEGSHKVKKPVEVKVFFGDYPAGERLSGKTLDKIKDIKVSVISPEGTKEEVVMTQQENYWTGTFTPKSSGMYSIVGINDVRDVQDWTKHELGIVRPIQYLKAYCQAGKTVTHPAAALFLDVNVRKISAGNYELTALKNGTPIASQKVLLNTYGGGEKVLNTDANGKAAFSVAKPALYILSLEWIDRTPGEFNGKAYETVRHILDYTLSND